MEVLIGNKKFHVGLEWHTYADKEDAKERLKEFKEDGYDAVLFKVGGKHQVCVSKKEKLKHPILATGFFHLLYGYYYMPLEGAVWVLLKGDDGTVIHEGVYRDLESFEAENSEKVLPFLKDRESRKKLSLTDAQGFKKKTEISPVFLFLPLVAAVFIGLLFFAVKTVFKSKVSPAPQVNMPLPPPKPSTPSTPTWGKLDLSCFEKFYEEALLKGNASCDWTLSDKKQDKKDMVKCEEATTLIGGLSNVQWGEVKDYGEVVGYQFNISGSFFVEDLKKLEVLAFEELKLSLSGSLKNFQVKLDGVVLCRR